MRKLTALTVALALAVSAMAFIEDKPAGAQFTPEQSQEQVAQQQAANGTIGVVGTVESDTTGPAAPEAGGDPTAAAVLTGGATDDAKRTLANEGKRLDGEQGGLPWWVWALVLCGAGFGVVAGARAYANRVVPIPTAQKQQW